LPATTPEVRTREFVLSFPETVHRYSILKSRLEKSLADRGRLENGRDVR
jgi:hypothetical protein